MSDVKRIGVMMDLDKPFKRHLDVYAGIREYAEECRDWRFVVDDWADHAIPSRPGLPVPYDGIVGRITKLGADRARRIGLPAVNVWFSSPAKHVLPGVYPDSTVSGRLLAEHLLSRGFRHLTALFRPDDKATPLVAAGMKAFATEAGFDGWLGTLSLAQPTAHTAWKRGLQQIERWMESWKLPIGLLVIDPAWARVVIELAAVRGWHVPQQIAIVCSHNDELHCEHPEPGLTAVETPEFQCGYEAAKMLDKLIDGKRRGQSPFASPQTILLPPTGLVVRHSTDFFAVDDPLLGRALRYIASHLHKPLDAGTVAREVGVARRTLDDWFQKSLGMTATDEIARLRLERVKRELLATPDSIEAIARRTGFANTRTLRNHFRKIAGISPSEFREQATSPPRRPRHQKG
jgi:LacI family transcriptional regulator